MNNYFCTNSSCNLSQQQTQQSQSCCCPCSDDFRRLLELLCSQELQPLIDFSKFAFISDFYILGTALTTPSCGTAPGDNLDCPSGSYVCGGDSCETITVSGPLFPPAPTSCPPLNVNVTQAALCRLTAISFDAATVDGCSAGNFQTISQILTQLLRPNRSQSCDCMADALISAASARTATVVAGPLIVENSAILGQLGNILVLANSTDHRFYLICANHIDFIG